MIDSFRFTGFPLSIISFACSRYSAITSLDIIFITMAIPKGTNIRSSKFQRIGIGLEPFGQFMNTKCKCGKK